MRDRPVLKWILEKEDKVPLVSKPARAFFAILDLNSTTKEVFLVLVLHQKTVETGLEYKIWIL